MDPCGFGRQHWWYDHKGAENWQTIKIYTFGVHQLMSISSRELFSSKELGDLGFYNRKKNEGDKLCLVFQKISAAILLILVSKSMGEPIYNFMPNKDFGIKPF